jgi:hypothetical protein
MQNRQVFSQDTTDVLEDRMVSGDQWNPISMRFFFVLEERLSVQLCHLINCGLYFAMIISSVSEVLFGDISLFLDAGRGRADGQTFWHTFEIMGWVTARWHKIQMRVRGFSVEVKLDSPVRECGCGVQKRIFGGEMSTVNLMELWKEFAISIISLRLSRPSTHFISMS